MKMSVFKTLNEVEYWVDGVSQGRFKTPPFLSSETLYFAVVTYNQNSEVEIVE